MPAPDNSGLSRAAHEFASEDYSWTARVRWIADPQASAGTTTAGKATAYTRNHAFSIGQPASFKESDEHPSAVEYLLGALGGDLLSGFHTLAARHGVPIDGMEVSLSGRLNNPLVFLGVIGEAGHPGFEEITGTLYVSTDADEPTLQKIWQMTLARSPLVNTLNRCLTLSLNLKVVG